MAYVQCRLERGEVQHTTWLPERFAVAGKSLSLRRSRELSGGGCLVEVVETPWEAGWVVLEVGARIESTEFAFVEDVFNESHGYTGGVEGPIMLGRTR